MREKARQSENGPSEKQYAQTKSYFLFIILNIRQKNKKVEKELNINLAVTAENGGNEPILLTLVGVK